MLGQIETVTTLLDKESVTTIGTLLAICCLLIYDRVKKESKYDELLDKYEKEQNSNKAVLIELVKKSIIATEQNTNAINSIKDAQLRR